MEFTKGAPIKTADGKRVGSVEQVVIDPADGRVTHLLAHTGHLFGTDKVVPVEAVNETGDEEVTLNFTEDEVKALPDLIDLQYIPLSDVETARYGFGSDMAQPVFWYPLGGPVGFTYPSAYPDTDGRPFKIESHINMPEGTIALSEGAKVFDRDESAVGNVVKIITGDSARDGERNQIVGLLVSQGLLHQVKKMVPANWIRDIDADGVHLNVSEDTINRVREYQE